MHISIACRVFFALALSFGAILPGGVEAELTAPKKIVTTFTILQDIAQNVAGEVTVVQSITKPGAEIHEYDPTPLDIVKAQSADLVLWNGLGLERWFEKFFGKLRGVPSVIATDGITPIGIAEGPYNGKPNPHCWMSPKNALRIVENIKHALIQLDPKHSAEYELNAAAYSAKIATIDTKLSETINRLPEEKRWLVTSEGAFTYLIRDYRLKELFLWPVNADEQGTPQQVRKVIDTVRMNKIPVVFSESTISNKPMLQVAGETGAKYGGVLYVDSLTGPEGPASTYLKLLEYNVTTIIQDLK